MKNYLISCYVHMLLLLFVSCRGQNDNNPENAATQSGIEKAPQVIDTDSIRTSELEQLLLKRFRCYVIRQSLIDAGKLDMQDDSCFCQTEQQEKMISERVKSTENISETVDLEKELEALDATEQAVISDLSDAEKFTSFWTHKIFIKPLLLAKFKSSRDTLQKQDSKILFTTLQDSLSEWMITDYPVLADSADSRAARIVKSLQAKNENASPVIETKPLEETDRAMYWHLLAVISCACSLIALIVSFDRKRPKLTSNKDEPEQNIPRSTLPEHLLKPLKIEVEKLKDEMILLQKWKAAATEKERNETVSQKFSAAPQPAETVPLEIVNTTPPLRLLFFSAPNSDGTFQNSSGRNEPIPGASIYRFELQNETTASFTALDSNDAANLALGTPENALKPACEYVSIPSRVEQILTDHTGSASLEGAVWKVTRKAKIRFR